MPSPLEYVHWALETWIPSGCSALGSYPEAARRPRDVGIRSTLPGQTANDGSPDVIGVSRDLSRLCLRIQLPTRKAYCTHRLQERHWVDVITRRSHTIGAIFWTMSNPFTGLKDVLEKTLPPSLLAYLNARDGAAHFLRELPLMYPPKAVAQSFSGTTSLGASGRSFCSARSAL